MAGFGFDGGWFSVEQVRRPRLRRVEQSHDDPRAGMLVDRSDEKMGVVLLYHLTLEALTELRLPLVTVLLAPGP
jgi:hypothetical protein